MFRRRTDRILVTALSLASLASSAIVVLIVYHLVSESMPALRDIGLARFVSDEAGWHPVDGAGRGAFNLVPMLIGSLAVTAGAVFVAAPVGVMSALFCNFYAAARWQQRYRRIVEVMAGIPSVVYGLWGLVTLVPLVRAVAPPGPSLLAGMLVLGVMTIPTIAMLSDAAVRAVPREHSEAAAALDLSRATTILRIILPVARPSLTVAVVLGMMRAIGETMAVLMVCGNIAEVPESLFAPVRTLTANIALELGYATSDHRSALFVSGLALMVPIVVLVFIVQRFQRAKTRA